MSNDYWRTVPGYPNYQVSRCGEVRSLGRNKLLALYRNDRGYLLVNLYRDGRAKNFLVHRLIASAFLGVIPQGWQVNHLDGDKGNNRVENLEVVTQDENLKHAARTGLLRVGEANHKAKLTEKEVVEIRRLRAEGVRVQEIAYRFNVSERAVYLASNRLTWRHVA